MLDQFYPKQSTKNAIRIYEQTMFRDPAEFTKPGAKDCSGTDWQFELRNVEKRRYFA